MLYPELKVCSDGLYWKQFCSFLFRCCPDFSNFLTEWIIMVMFVPNCHDFDRKGVPLSNFFPDLRTTVPTSEAFAVTPLVLLDLTRARLTSQLQTFELVTIIICMFLRPEKRSEKLIFQLNGVSFLPDYINTNKYIFFALHFSPIRYKPQRDPRGRR